MKLEIIASEKSEAFVFYITQQVSFGDRLS